MKEENFINSKYFRKKVMYSILLISICLSILFFVKFLTNISIGADNPNVLIEGKLEKYINFKISDEDKGTLVQYDVKSGVEQESDVYSPIKESELVVNLNQLDGKYPYLVKVIAKSTEVTNGKKENIQEDYEYDVVTGTVVIRASNVNENGETIKSEKPNQDARDEYIIICYYDTYTEEAEERELDIKVTLNAVLFEGNIAINQENEFKGKVKEDIGVLTSVEVETSDIYNGYIKSNIINQTTYNTTYEEVQKIMISKKETQEKINISEENTIIKTVQEENGEEITEELSNNGNLVYKSTKISKENIVEILGENGEIEILDVNDNVIATIDKDTEFNEDETKTIYYENEPEIIIIKTSEIQNEGILEIANTKEIKNTMLEVDVDIKTTGKITGINEEIIETETEEVTKNEIEVFVNSYENIIEIKDSQTNIDMKINNTEWTNKQQNEVVFDVYANSNTVKGNMLKNPIIKIELPNEVEKVILGESSVVYANGLGLQNPYLETNENGNIVIVANLIGEQTTYNENTLGLITDVKISATVILKKDIKNSTENVNLIFANNYTLDGETELKNKNQEIQIQSYKEESTVIAQEEVSVYSTEAVATALEDTSGLEVEVTPIKGDTTIADGDTVYEGEYIKYNVKVTNTSDKQMNNVTIVGSIPEGTVYGELEADYYNAIGEYKYNYDETLTSKTIEIGSLGTGESANRFYEVKVKDLEENQTERKMETNIKAYVGNIEASSYTITNVIKSAEVEVFLSANLDNAKDRWNYHLKIISKEAKTVTLELQLPSIFELELIVHEQDKVALDDKVNISENNLVTMQVDVDSEEKEWIFEGTMDALKLEKQTEESKTELKAIATVLTSENSYKSNENRIIFEYQSASIVMTSSKEGEEIKYNDEIDYEITITNTGKTNLDNSVYSYISVELTDFLPENINPVSVTYENWEEELIEEDDETESYIATGKFKKVEVTEDISAIKKDENGDKLPNVDLHLIIPDEESVVIKIKATAGFVYEKAKIENSATIAGRNIVSKISNTIMHTILPYNYEEIENSDDSDNPDNPVNPDDSDNTDDSTGEKDKYSISGVAWLDENEDGQRQISEKLLNGITIMLVDTSNSSAVKAKVKTDVNGAYKFSDLEAGNYIVIFKYDTDTYSVSEYKKSGISNEVNSDAISETITIQGEQTKVGLTDILSLDASLSNIDIGLVKNKICDLKLDKYISKVIVKTNTGTKEQTYNNASLAKVEIKAKEIEGATVVIEYKLAITNEGEIATNVNKVFDYLPDGLEFSSELNKNWINQNGKLINTSIANEKLEPEETREVNLILTKTMTSSTTGTFTNIAEIGEASNSLGIKDTDSTSGNKVEQEDDYSKAELIVSVSTGAIIYISFIIAGIVIASILIFLNCKFGKLKINKKFIFGITLISVMFIQTTTAIASEITQVPEYADFIWIDDGSTNSERFQGEGNMGWATCIEQGLNASNYYVTFTLKKLDNPQEYRREEKVTAQVTLNKLNNNEDVEIIELGENYLLGPFKIEGASGNNYSYEIGTDKGNTVTGASVCDQNGNSKTISGGTNTFYLKIAKNKFASDEGIAKVKVTAKANVTKETTIYYKGRAIYYRPGDTWNGKAYQSIITDKEFYNKDSSTSTYEESKSVEWKYEKGNLEIVKQDADNSNVKLEGVQIKVTGSNFDKTYTTDANGKITIKDLKQGTYTITEISNTYYGYNVMATGTVTVKGGMTNTYTLKNTKQTGNLKIEKQDADSGKYLEGVSFNIKRKDENKYIQVKVGNEWKTNCEGIVHLSDMRFVDNEENATVFTTNENGIIEIRNILKGTYEVKEISVGDETSGYEIDDNYISWSYTSVANDSNKGAGTGKTATVAVWRRSSLNTENPPAYENRNEVLTFKNQKKYVNLSGYVWLDKASSKQSVPNDLYKTNEHSDTNISTYEDDKDELLPGIKVTLKDKTTGETVLDKNGNEMTTTTTEKGSYLFEKVEINNLANYYVEFEYNGLKYQNVTKNLDKDTGSKAEEGKRRQDFNEKFVAVTNNKRIDGIELKYTSGNHESILNNSDSFSKMQANTYNAGYNIAQYYDSTKDTIENVNLGLYEREQPDISLVKDLHSVNVSINGYNNIYQYAYRFKHEDDESMQPTEDDLNVGVKYKNEYTSSYNRAIYEADYKYTNEQDKSKELKVYVTYKIKMINETTGLSVKVNSVVDYFDINYYINSDGTYNKVKVGTVMDEKGNVGREIDAQGNAVDEIYPSVDTYNEEYAKTMIYTNVEIEAGKSRDMYVQFELNRDAVINILSEKENLDNVAEIYSYTTYYDDKLYAGVDKDSKPGNAIPGNEGTYEDDTDAAPGLLLEVANNSRKMSGKVFLDESTGGVTTERQGSGAYEDGEKGIAGVEVTLREKLGTELEYKATTDENGDFLISGFIPGDYTLIYTWGGQTYKSDDGDQKTITVQDYKGTIVDEESYMAKVNAEPKTEDKKWYKDSFKQKYLEVEWDSINNKEIRVSDAVDDYGIRKEIDEGTGTTTKMDSTTPTMEVGVEYETTTTASTGNQYTYEINSIDFGIVERPRQEINVDKRISSIKLTLANGQTLVDATVNDDGELEGNAVQKLIYMAPSINAEPENGFAKIELDNELIQGSTIQVGYKIVVENNSEIDYDSEHYYKYGTLDSNENKKDKIIKIKPSGIYDYLDSSMTLDKDNNVDEENGVWKIISMEEYNNTFTDEQPATVVEEYLRSYYSSTEEDGNIIEITGYESFQDQYAELITEWTKEKLTKLRQKRLANKTILNNEKLEEEVEPGGTNEVEIFASKVLSNSNEIELNNDVEITKVERNSNSGREVTPTNCVLYDKGESVTVTPSTGENRDYTSIVILTISLFTILGTGIVFIKKKVLG